MLSLPLSPSSPFSDATPFHLTRSLHQFRKQLDISAINTKCFAIDEGVRHPLVSRVNNSTKSLPGGVHLVCSFFLIHALQVSKTDRLTLINRKNHFFKERKRYGPWLEVNTLRNIRNSSLALWSGHDLVLALTFVQGEQLTWPCPAQAFSGVSSTNESSLKHETVSWTVRFEAL